MILLTKQKATVVLSSSKHLDNLFIMKKFSFFYFTLLLAFLGNLQIGSAQDCGGFVNPNFDVVSTCPSYYSDVASFTGWDQVTVWGTADGTCDCATWWDSEGNGELGTCPPWASGFVGAASYSYYYNIPAGYTEYVGNCLTTPWQSGQTYTVTFDIYQTLGGGSVPISVLGYQGTTCPTIPFQAGTTGYDELCGQPHIRQWMDYHDIHHYTLQRYFIFSIWFM